MPVFALYNFDNPASVEDEALENGNQYGDYRDGAHAEDGRLILDGIDDKAKIYPSDSFQLERGTLEIQFKPTDANISGPQTVLSRDTQGEHPGSFRIEVYPDGSVQVTHEVNGTAEVFSTGPDFYTAGEEIRLSYSWDSNGTGGGLQIDNLDTGADFSADVPNSVDLVMDPNSQPWILGAGQNASTPYLLNDLENYFQGEVEFFSLSDTVDNISPPTDPDRDGIVRGTDGGDLIDTSYIDPWDADRIDANDAILGNDAPNDDRVRAGAGNDTIHAGAGNDTVWAGTGDDLVYGGAGNDDLRGGEGNDSFEGGDGRDTVYGGNGDDLIDTSSPLTSRPLPDIDYPGYYPADADPNNDRDLVYGGHGNDTIRTGDDADTIYGGAGQDSIDAGIDADLVHGGDGDDTLIGNEGADTIYGGHGDDLIYGGFGDIGGDVLDLPDDVDLRPDNNRDELHGGGGNDTIFGRDDDDTLYGGSGDDLMYGGVDDDHLLGGVGHDTLHGDAGNDRLEGMAGTDVLYGGAGEDLLFGGFGRDTLYGGEGADTLHGDDGHDILFGGAGDNTLYGGAGNDTLHVGTGSEQLFGGADRDLFIVDHAGNGINDFIDGNEEGNDWDTLDLRGSGPHSIAYDPTNAENGVVTFYDRDGNETGTLEFINIENVIPCFTPGTLIATPRGEVPVESLRAGDKVITRDNGIQEIRWIGEKPLSGQDLRLNSHLQPILIKAHSLGNGLPERDMLVSPNHRLLVASDRTQLYFDEHEVLVAAKHLVGAQGIHAIESIGVTYVHFMCDRHEVVLSNGSWTESFQPGDYTLKGLGNAQRNEIFELFPELKTPVGVDSYHAARRTLKRHEARLLAR